MAFAPWLQEKRKAVLDRFYTKFDAESQNESLADNFTFQERVADSKAFSKQGMQLDCPVQLHYLALQSAL